MLFKGFKNLSLYYLVSALFLTDKCLCLWSLEARSPADIRVPAPRDKSRLTMSFSQFHCGLGSTPWCLTLVFVRSCESSFAALFEEPKSSHVSLWCFSNWTGIYWPSCFQFYLSSPSGLARAAGCWFSAGVCLFPDDVPMHRVAWGCAFYELRFISDTLKGSASRSVLAWVSCDPFIHLCPREISLSTENMLGDSKS